jgi:hypothetical protein
VQRLARTLHVLTSGQAIPAPLRLFTSKWIASDGTIADFAKELAYFARPNGADFIREVYVRCAAAQVVKKRATATSKPSAESKAESKTEKSPKPVAQTAKRRRAPLVIASVALLMALAIGIAFSRPQTGQAGSSDLLTNLVARAGEFARSLGDVRTQLANLSSQLSAHLASGADQPAAAQPGRTTAPPASSRPPGNTLTSTTQSSAPLPARTFPSIARSSTAGSPGAASAPTLDLSALRPPDAGRPESPIAAPVPALRAETVNPEAIYTSADEGISPPTMLYPQLPPPPLVISKSSNNVNVMEIVIGGDGAVERVQLVSQPRRLTDMMLLSGAKSWKFTPASKNGLPVRYRMAFAWATTP